MAHHDDRVQFKVLGYNVLLLYYEWHIFFFDRKCRISFAIVVIVSSFQMRMNVVSPSFAQWTKIRIKVQYWRTLNCTPIMIMCHYCLQFSRLFAQEWTENFMKTKELNKMVKIALAESNHFQPTMPPPLFPMPIHIKSVAKKNITLLGLLESYRDI